MLPDQLNIGQVIGLLAASHRCRRWSPLKPNGSGGPGLIVSSVRWSLVNFKCFLCCNLAAESADVMFFENYGAQS